MGKTYGLRSSSKISENRKGIDAKALTFFLGEGAALFSFVLFAVLRDINGVLFSLLTMVLAGAVFLIEKIFKCRMSTVFCVLAVLYSFGPLLGEGYKLYYLSSCYDKLLHTFAGIMFAIVGAYLPVKIDPRLRDDVKVRLIFAVCFSMAVSVAWEFFEFGADRLLGFDMQHDAYIESINSFLLSSDPGKLSSIGSIDSVAVNGEMLEGYIDIGLIDTMTDMLVETLGAVLFAVYFRIDRNRHPLFTPVSTDRYDVEMLSDDQEALVSHA